MQCYQTDTNNYVLKTILKASIQSMDIENWKATSTKAVKIFYNRATSATGILKGATKISRQTIVRNPDKFRALF